MRTKLIEFKTELRKLRITHQKVSDYTGHTRESVTLWLNGTLVPPEKSEAHLVKEVREMITLKRLQKKEKNVQQNKRPTHGHSHRDGGRKNR